MPNFWMIRAGGGGHLAAEFKEKSIVAIGWPAVGELTQANSVAAMRNLVATAYPELSSGAIINAGGVLHKFCNVAILGDDVLSYDPERRMYLLGKVTGQYQYRTDILESYPNVREVKWESEVSRDDLSISTKNTLGSTLTLFEPGPAVLAELKLVASGEGDSEPPSPDLDADLDETPETIFQDTLSRAHEFIKDRLLRLAPEEMEELAAALLRAMGYKTRVTPRGPDQGRDVVASPDGLGFQSPRIVVEVKHRPKESIGVERIRGFIGGLRGGDRGLYVSTGGFTRESRYEADRANVPLTLVDSDYLATLIVEHYDAFDAEGRSLVPLRKVYWPLP